MALRAQGDEIFLSVIALLAPEPGVVDLQIRHGATGLASPAIALKHLQAQLLVGSYIQANSRPSLQCAVHAACVTSRRNEALSAAGKKRNNRSMENSRILGSAFSTCAPARKSAQIISRQ